MRWLIPATTLVATVSNNFAQGLPGAHALHGTNLIVPAIVSSRSNWPKPLNRSDSIDIIGVTRRDSDDGEQTPLKKRRMSLRGVYVWGINSTVTKHLEDFVSNDTSERLTRRCENSSWQNASEFLFIKTPLFLSEVSNKKINKQTRKWPLRRAANVTFSKFRCWRPADFWNRASCN